MAGVLDDTAKLGMQRRLSIAGKGNHIRRNALGLKCLQFLLQRQGYFGAGRQEGIFHFAIETALAIHAVEGAEFSLCRHKVHAERYTQTSAVNRPIYDLVEQHYFFLFLSNEARAANRA